MTALFGYPIFLLLAIHWIFLAKGKIFGILVLAVSQLTKTHIPYRLSKYIEESFLNAMETGNHTVMAFFPIMMFDEKFENSHFSLQWKLEVYSN